MVRSSCPRDSNFELRSACSNDASFLVRNGWGRGEEKKGGNREENKSYTFIVLSLFSPSLPHSLLLIADVQQEEYYNYLAQSDTLDIELERCLVQREKHQPMDDSAAKTLFQMKNANFNQFISGSKKQVSKRKGDAALNNQYYKIKF
jgi:hypothetical protein